MKKTLLTLYFTKKFACIINSDDKIVWWERNHLNDNELWVFLIKAAIALYDENQLYKSSIQKSTKIEVYIFHTGIVECIKYNRSARRVRRALAHVGYHPNKAMVPTSQAWNTLIKLLENNNFKIY